MAALSSEDFQNAIRARYDSDAKLVSPSEISSQLDDSLRGILVTLWEKVQWLQASTLQPPTGDQASDEPIFHGEFKQVVEAWQQATLCLPRATLAPNDPQFRNELMARYTDSCDTMSIDEIAKSLDGEFLKGYSIFWEFRYQLHLCVEEVARTRDPDMAELTKRNLQILVKAWKAAILNRPRTNVLRSSNIRK